MALVEFLQAHAGDAVLDAAAMARLEDDLLPRALAAWPDLRKVLQDQDLVFWRWDGTAEYCRFAASLSCAQVFSLAQPLLLQVGNLPFLSSSFFFRSFLSQPNNVSVSPPFSFFSFCFLCFLSFLFAFFSFPFLSFLFLSFFPFFSACRPARCAWSKPIRRSKWPRCCRAGPVMSRWCSASLVFFAPTASAALFAITVLQRPWLRWNCGTVLLIGTANLSDCQRPSPWP